MTMFGGGIVAPECYRIEVMKITCEITSSHPCLVFDIGKKADDKPLGKIEWGDRGP